MALCLSSTIAMPDFDDLQDDTRPILEQKLIQPLTPLFTLGSPAYHWNVNYQTPLLQVGWEV